MSTKRRCWPAVVSARAGLRREQTVDPAGRRQSVGHDQHQVGVGRHEGLVGHRFHAVQADLGRDIHRREAADEVIGARFFAEQVVDARTAAQVQEQDADTVRLGCRCDGRDLGDLRGHRVVDRRREPIPARRRSERGGDLPGELLGSGERGWRIDEHHVDPRLSQLGEDVPWADGAVRDDQGGAQREHGLRVDRVSAGRHERQALATGEGRRDVAPDERIAESEPLYGRGDRPRQVEPEHARGVVHDDLDVAPVIVGCDGHRQRLLRPRIERHDLGIRQHRAARPLERARVVEQRELGQRRLTRDGGGRRRRHRHRAGGQGEGESRDSGCRAQLTHEPAGAARPR